MPFIFFGAPIQSFRPYGRGRSVCQGLVHTLENVLTRAVHRHVLGTMGAQDLLKWVLALLYRGESCTLWNKRVVYHRSRCRSSPCVRGVVGVIVISNLTYLGRSKFRCCSSMLIIQFYDMDKSPILTKIGNFCSRYLKVSKKKFIKGPEIARAKKQWFPNSSARMFINQWFLMDKLCSNPVFIMNR